MFGWFSRSTYHEQRWISETIAGPVWRCTPLCVARWLPSLGPVLYVPAHRPKPLEAPSLNGLLVETATLQPLLHVRSLQLFGAIGADGPREWIDCSDRAGRVLAQLHLLPDTDYLAWDRLPGKQDANVKSAVRRQASFWVGDAFVMGFTCRALGSLSCLAEVVPPPLSLLGATVARAIAGSHPLYRAADRMRL